MMCTSLEESMVLGPGKIALAQCRLKLVHRRGGDAAQSESMALQNDIGSLESQWTLRRLGLQVLEEVLVHQGVRNCVSLLYYYMPLLMLLPASALATQPAEVRDLAHAAGRMGVEGLHDAVDSLCSKHTIFGAQCRHGLVQEWLLNPSWKPCEVPRALAALDAIESVCEPQLLGGGRLFEQPRDMAFTVERCVLLAQPRSAPAADPSVGKLPKERREDTRAQINALLRILFTDKVDRWKIRHDAKVRLLTVLFRTVSADEVEKAYRRPMDDVLFVWRVNFYLDKLEKLGVHMDFRRFGLCDKEKLARSLWRSHKADPNMMQVLAALCLDFDVHDGGFWAALLAKLNDLQQHAFLRDVLLVLYEQHGPKLEHDAALVPTLADLMRAPVDAVVAWHRAGGDGPPLPEAQVSWLAVMPRWLAQSPFVASLEVVGLAYPLLEVSQSEELSDQQVERLAVAVFGRSERPSCRRLLGTLAFEIALADTSAPRVEDFVREEIALKRPWLVIPCLARCCGSYRQILFAGCLQHQLSAAAREALHSDVFNELVQFAVATCNIGDLLHLALQHAQYQEIAKLLAMFARHHQVPAIGGILSGADQDMEDATSEQTKAVAYLDELFRRLRASPEVGEAFEDFAEHLCH